MTVRFRLALTVLLTGLLTAVGVIATLALAFQRFEQEATYARADAFLGRVVGMYDDLLDLHQRNPVDFNTFLRNLLLFEPDSQLYLLAADGTVLAHSGSKTLGPGVKVALVPVKRAAASALDGPARRLAPYVMGDDPQRMNTEAVVAARPLMRSLIRAADPVAGYLYLVCQKQAVPGATGALFRSSLMGPALGSVAALIVVATALALWIIGTVTRPLRVLSVEVAAAARDGFSAAAAAGEPMPPPLPLPLPVAGNDEFALLRHGFRAMLATLRQQWDQLRALDHFRRESVSNLSHDLRSPLTATVACLETLDQRWLADASRNDDRHLVSVALRNARNAAGMVRSLGDLALLDEPTFKLHRTRLNLAEVLDDITLRFAQRAAQQGVGLGFEERGDTPAVAEVDVELFERAVANVLDNALKHTRAGARITVSTQRVAESVEVAVADQGVGIAPQDLPRLFDRLYQARQSVAPATSEEGKGLGLAIVKRIVELHHGQVRVSSQLGGGTVVTVVLPAA